MKALLDDLVDFSRTKLGLGINISLADADLAALFADELEQLRGAHPERQLELEVVGDTRGRWDGLRLQQLLRNLVSNAIKYGAPGAPVRVVLTGEEADVRFEVRNSGPAIERSALDQIFDPLKRGPAQGQLRHRRRPWARTVYRARSCPGAWWRGRCAFRKGRDRVRCAPASPQ